MNRASELLTCPLCGTQYDEDSGNACHSACPVSSGCGLLRCPQCGYEQPPPTRLTRRLSRWLSTGKSSE